MDEVSRATNRTELRVGLITVPAALFNTTGKPPSHHEYEKAGPNGKPLRLVDKAQEAAEAPSDDPIGVVEDPGPDPDQPNVWDGPQAPATDAGAGEYRKVLVEEGSEDEVKPDQVRRGIRREDGNFVDLTEHLERIENESRLEAIEVITFIDRRHVPRERIVGSFYLACGGERGAALQRTLYEGMKDSGRVAVVKWTKRKGQTLGIMGPHPSGAVVCLELSWAAQMRAPNGECKAHLHAKVTRSEVTRAIELIDAMAGKRADLDALEDRRWQAENELLARAEAGELDDYTLEPEERPEEMESLERLLAESIPA